MAKSKWEKLSLAMSLMVDRIQKDLQHLVRWISEHNFLQLRFQANALPKKQSTLDYSQYVRMANIYRIFLGAFSTNLNLKKELKKPFLAYPLVYQPLIPDSASQKVMVRTWSVKIHPAKKLILKSTDLLLELLLYCPLPSEYKECQKWFEEDHQTYLLFDKMHALYLEALEEQKILDNLARPIEKYFKNFMKSKTLLENPRQSLPFKLVPEDNIKIALEKVTTSRIDRKIGSAYDLFKDWEEQVQTLVFQDSDWSKEEKNACLLRMKRFIKHNYTKLGHEDGPGYKQTAGELFRKRNNNETLCFDKNTMARVIQWFLEKFIEDHNDKKSGQIVCILWLSIWLSHEIGDGVVSIEKIIDLSSKEINFKSKFLVIDGQEIKVSHGLMKLLFILIGKGKGLRDRRLFPDINKRILKNVLHNAFKILFPDQTSSFSLNSLLYFPHQFVGHVLPSSLLKKMRNPDALAGKIGDLKGCLLKNYKTHITH